MKYNKLVRDKIPQYIKSRGGDCKIHFANEAEYWNKLKEKLAEEMAEFKESESIDELVDILEVIDAVIEFKKFDWQEISDLKKKKADIKGHFKERIILEES